MTDHMNKPGVPKGSYAAGERVKIPVGAERPYTVFVNGVEQTEGDDFNVEDRELVFTRPIVKEEASQSDSLWQAMNALDKYFPSRADLSSELRSDLMQHLIVFVCAEREGALADT